MTSSVLKLIAIFAMLTDHIVKVFGQSFVMIFFPDSLAASFYVVHIMEIVGRLTFPIMAFFIAEGCRKTSSMPKYMARLFGFALLSQIPYTLAMNWELTFIDLRDLNVMFTLGFGALAVFLYEKFNRTPLSCIFVTVVVITAGFLEVDYSLFGVLLVFAAYAFPTRKTQLLGMAAVLTVLYLWYGNGVLNFINAFSTPHSLWINAFYGVFLGLGQWFGALLALMLLFFYNGERGKGAKYLFYTFYPAHLLVLVIIRESIRFYNG